MKTIFVFGSNEAGIHGAGAAKHAMSLGAIYGQGFGPMGDTFGIPTKDWGIKSLKLPMIEYYVSRFIAYARVNPKTLFKVTAVGCGLAGFHHYQMAPMFAGAPRNCAFDEAWRPYLPEHQIWGTFSG